MILLVLDKWENKFFEWFGFDVVVIVVGRSNIGRFMIDFFVVFIERSVVIIKDRRFFGVLSLMVLVLILYFFVSLEIKDFNFYEWCIGWFLL